MEVSFVGGSFPVILEALNATDAEVAWQTSILSNVPLLLFNPIIGVLVEKFGFSLVFFLGNLVGVLTLVLMIFPSYPVQVVNLVIFSMQKAFLFTVTFSFLLLEFPIEVYGTLAALVIFVAFGVGFLDTPLLTLVGTSEQLITTSALNDGYVSLE